MPLTKASPHFSTDVVLLRAARAACSASRGTWQSRPWRPAPAGCRSSTCAPTDVDAAMGDLEPQRVGEVLDAGLGGVVGRQPGRRERRQRRHHQHVAAPLDDRPAVRRAPCGTPRRTLTSMTRLERLRIDLQHRPEAGDAGVGHHDVDATEPLDSLRRRRPAWPPGRGRRRPTVSTRSSPSAAASPPVPPRRGRSGPAWRPWRAAGGRPPRRSRWHRR